MTIRSTRSAGDSPWPQSRVRFATPDDMPALMSMCQRLATENAIGPPNMALVERQIAKCVSKDRGFIGVIGDGNTIEGAMCLEFAHMWYSDNIWWVQDVFHFVLPEYRASNNANDLLDWAIWWKEQLNIPLMLGIVSNDRTRAKIKLYERKLGPLSGAYFLIGAKTGLEGE